MSVAELSLSLPFFFLVCFLCKKKKKVVMNVFCFFFASAGNLPLRRWMRVHTAEVSAALMVKSFLWFSFTIPIFLLFFLGVLYIYPGGVGRNLADGLSRLARRSPLFVSVVGDDESGRELIRHNPLMVISNATTAQFSYCSSAVSSECRFNWN